MRLCERQRSRIEQCLSPGIRGTSRNPDSPAPAFLVAAICMRLVRRRITLEFIRTQHRQVRKGHNEQITV